ncbi:sterol desaturase family protein [Membranihabitans marinus]|uniref:sterol desaturase family protein n=1 Tax=Membranihabitans marinus TaxID=1227546 RepID=UPI00374D962F
MDKYIEILTSSFTGYGHYLFQEITQPSWHNYFYWLIGLSLMVWVIEIIIPWVDRGTAFRKDFWLDGFYMIFNFFIFSLVGYNAISDVAVEMFNDVLAWGGMENLVAVEIGSWPVVLQWLTMFVVVDFVQWFIHILLHRIPFLWEFHKLHHSVKEMGFAAHFRFHWMEIVVYKTLQYIPLAMIGFGIQDFFIIHVFTILVGHLNHSNIGWDYGPFKYLLNNPKMHIWHHAKILPYEHRYGANFGQSLSIWDYIFKTAYIPKDGKNIELGFPGDEEYPQGVKKQWLAPFIKSSKSSN